MADLVVTCPKAKWEGWIAEGDAAGEPYTGEEWGWYMRSRNTPDIKPGERVYVVAHDKLRGYAPLVRVVKKGLYVVLCRRGGAVAVTLKVPIRGFRGYRYRWWSRDIEIPFPGWRKP